MTANIPAVTYDPRSPSEGRRFYVELNGNDQNDGLTPASPFKTWATALTAVNNLVPPVDSNNPAAIYSSSSGTFFEQIVVPNSVSIFAPGATLEFNDNGTTTLDIQGGNGVYQFRVIRNSGIGSIGVRSTDASLFTAEFDLIDCDDGTAFYHAGNFSGANVIDCKNMRYGVAGVNNISTLTNAGLKVNVEVFRPVDASAEAFIQNGANPSVLEASEVSTTEATGATFINCKQGMIDAQIERTETTDAIIVENTGIVGLIANNVTGDLTVNAGGILNARIISYFGVKTFNGTVNGNIAGDRQGTDALGGGAASGSDEDVQFNDSGLLGADNRFKFDVSEGNLLSPKFNNVELTSQGTGNLILSDSGNYISAVGSLLIDSDEIKLENDEDSPDPDSYYGTNNLGEKGYKPLPPVQRYTKITVFEDTNLNNFNSGGGFADVPGLQITIDRDGDYTFYCALNCNNDQNEEIDLTIALTPINLRVIETPSGPVTVPAGTQFTSSFQVVRDRQQKTQDQTLDGTFLFDALEDGDLIDFRINTRGDNVDLSNRRAYGYTINSND